MINERHLRYERDRFNANDPASRPAGKVGLAQGKVGPAQGKVVEVRLDEAELRLVKPYSDHPSVPFIYTSLMGTFIYF
jgi:hypothetical protein